MPHCRRAGRRRRVGGGALQLASAAPLLLLIINLGDASTAQTMTVAVASTSVRARVLSQASRRWRRSLGGTLAAAGRSRGAGAWAELAAMAAFGSVKFGSQRQTRAALLDQRSCDGGGIGRINAVAAAGWRQGCADARPIVGATWRFSGGWGQCQWRWHPRGTQLAKRRAHLAVDEGADWGSGTAQKDEHDDPEEEDSLENFCFERVDMGGWRTLHWSDYAPSPPPSCSSAVVAEATTMTASNIGPARIEDLRPTLTPDYPSPVETVVVRDRIAYVKRDDLLRLKGCNVSGNKARKFLALNEIPSDDFPDAVVSYGGPQSNAMVAMAAIVQAKDAELAMATAEEGRSDSGAEVVEVGRGLDILNSDALDEVEVDMSIEEAAAMLRLDDDDDYDEEIDDGNGGDDRLLLSPSPPPPSRDRRLRFVYYTKKLPRYLRKQPNGNLLRALSLGMELVELSHRDYGALFGGDEGGSASAPVGLDPPVPGKSVWIPQGGFCGVAEPGARVLAAEIVSFWVNQGRGRPLSVCVPGGTCTTALFLHREIGALLREQRGGGDDDGDDLDIRVVVIPCVGDDAYAVRQMRALDLRSGGTGRDLPDVLRPRPDSEYGPARRKLNGYFVFGEPHASILQTFAEMKDEHGVFLDLLYGAPAWNLLLQQWKNKKATSSESPIAGRQVMYVHSGGLEGISPMLTRYKHKGLVDSSEIQQN